MSKLGTRILACLFALALIPTLPAPTPAQPAPAGDATFKVRIDWDAYVDVDLWVTEPSGQKVFYQRRQGAGILRNDNTSGGPNSYEVYDVKNGAGGNYRIEAHFFAVRPGRDGQPTPPGPVTVSYTLLNGADREVGSGTVTLSGPGDTKVIHNWQW